MQNVGKMYGRIRGKNTSFHCYENKWTWCGKGHSLKTLVARAKMRTRRSDSTVNWWVNVFSIANSPPYVFKDRNGVRRPYTEYVSVQYYRSIIYISIILTKLWGNVASIKKKKSGSFPDADTRGEPWQSICRFKPRRCTVAKLTKKIREGGSKNEWTNGDPIALM